MDCEAWRKETGLDDLVATWEYPEKEKIFEYYPQYYHKTDRVCFFSFSLFSPLYSLFF